MPGALLPPPPVQNITSLATSVVNATVRNATAAASPSPHSMFEGMSKREIFLHLTFHYQPSYSAAYALLVLFLLISVASAFRTIRSPTQNRYMWIIPPTGLIEARRPALRPP